MPNNKRTTGTYTGGDERTLKRVLPKPKDALFITYSEGRTPSKVKKKKLVKYKQSTGFWPASLIISTILRLGIGIHRTKELKVTCLERTLTYRDMLRVLQTLQKIEESSREPVCVTINYLHHKECIDSMTLELGYILETPMRNPFGGGTGDE